MTEPDTTPICVVEPLDDAPHGPLVRLWRHVNEHGELLAYLTIGWFGESVTLQDDQIVVLIDFLDEYRELLEGDDDDPDEQFVVPPAPVIDLDAERERRVAA